jgi:uncharacterized membrane protein YhhN
MILLVLAIVLAVLHWVAVLIKSRWLVGATKPTMMLALIAWVWIYSDLPALLAQPETFRLLWFVFGLSFSLAGDVFLLWPKHLFTPGLVAFLIGHVFYILGFSRLLVPGGAIVVCLVVAIVQAGCGVWVYRRLARGLEASGASRMKIPVGVYALVISIMLDSAIISLADPAWSKIPAVLVSVGALLFFTSDIMNGWNRFVAPIPNERIKIMVAYHLGQLGLAVGATLHFIAL